MASLSDVVDYQSAIDDLTTLTLAELLRFWRTLDTADGARAAEAVREFLPDLLDTFEPVAADTGAAFYDLAREEAGVRGAFAATPVETVDSTVVQKSIGWAVAPLFHKRVVFDARRGVEVLTDELAPDPAKALSRLSGVTQRQVANGARETVEDNAAKDPAKPRFARHASANACAFCALIATRGPVYRSAATAGDGRKYHDHCHCVVVPVWGQDYEPAPYVKTWQSAYAQARRDGAADVKSILSNMRSSLGVS